MKVTFGARSGEMTFSELRVGEAFLCPTSSARFIKSTATRAIRFIKEAPPCNVGISGNEIVQALPDTEVNFK